MKRFLLISSCMALVGCSTTLEHPNLEQSYASGLEEDSKNPVSKQHEG